jgi:cyclopropane-fatty-acyl-phospholipid synthase
VPCAIRLWNGREARTGDGAPRFTVVVRTPATLVMLALRPTMLAVGEAFVDGRLEVEGDLLAAVEATYRVGSAPGGVGSVVRRALDRVRPRRTRARAVARHYDVPADFFGLFLDRRMVYTCAVWPHADATLDEAQEAKLDLVCRKLRLAAGESFLDVGCGWGGLVARAADRYGANARGVTVSDTQATWASRMLADAGLAARARVERADYRELPRDLRVDKIAAVGVIEHVGVAAFPGYFARVHAWLRPGGLFLNHGITHASTTSPRTSGMAFLDRHVFPGGDLASLDHTLATMERAGFAIEHVEALGAHYVRTTREWLARLEAARTRAIALVGERTYRVWIAYLAAASVAFRAGWIDVHQVVARRR